MERGKDWQVTLVQEDALLFNAAPDGSVSMRVVPITEWEASLATNEASGSRRSVADVVRQIVSADGASSAALAGTSTSFRAATKSSLGPGPHVLRQDFKPHPLRPMAPVPMMATFIDVSSPRVTPV